MTAAEKLISIVQQELAGKWYYFEPRAGHALECALYLTDANGVQKPGIF